MKRSLPIAGISVLALLLLVVLGASGPAAAGTNLELLRAGQETPEAEPPQESGNAEAAQAFLDSNCTTCHPLADYGVEPGLRTTLEWEEVLTRMVSYGAIVSDENHDLLISYLATDRAGAGGGVDAEAAQAVLDSNCTICHPLADYGVEPGLRTTLEWEEVLTRMVSYGAIVSDENHDLLISYLATDRAGAGGGVDAEAAQAVLDSNCTTCHPLADYGIEPGLYTSAEWEETVNRMISYGAALTDEQKQLILDYLGTD